MDNIKNIIVGGAITLIIGGTAYSFTQQDVVNNLSTETGMTQEQATQYINDIPEEDLASWDVIGNDFIVESNKTRSQATEIDCENYEYDWESPTLTCASGKLQLQKIADAEQATGEAYIKISLDTAVKEDVQALINMLDELNAVYNLEVMKNVYTKAELDELITGNSYNKAILKAALESEQ